jgi:hypothetical protein
MVAPATHGTEDEMATKTDEPTQVAGEVNGNGAAPEQAPKPPPLLDAKGKQLTVAGMPTAEQTVGLIGPVTLPGDLLASLQLGQKITLSVEAVVKSVSGKATRDDWGDDKAEVRWQLYATDTEVA